MRNLGYTLLLVLMGGCTGTTIERVAVAPEANTCQVSEVRPTSLSTIVIGICWDAGGQPIGMAATGGLPSAAPYLAVIGAGALVGSAYILGSQVDGLTLKVPDR